MAARKRAYQTEKTKDTIRAGMLMKRLEDHAAGLVEMTSTQVRAAEIVLKKLRPDLSSVDMAASVDQTTRFVITDEPMTDEEWEASYSDGVATAGGAAESTH